MLWNRRRARLNEIQLQRTNGALSTQLLQLREQLRNKDATPPGSKSYCASATSGSTNSPPKSINSGSTADTRISMMLDLNDAVAAKQSVACAIG
jgi:hypothetical protein